MTEPPAQAVTSGRLPNAVAPNAAPSSAGAWLERARPVVRSLWLPVAAYLLSRAVVLGAIGVDMALRPGTSFAGDLTRWDAHWYLLIIQEGYPSGPVPDGQNATAFFPLFPLVARGVAAVTPLGALGAAVIVALLGGLLATCLVWLIARDAAGERAANRAALLFTVFPASYVFSIPYSEGLMLALSAGSLLALSRERWVAAGVLAALSTATRPNAVGLVLAAAVAAWIAIRRRRQLRALIAPALAPLGLITFVVFLWIRTGDAAVSWRAQRTGWSQRIDLGLTTVRHVGKAFTDPIDNLNRVGIVVALVVMIAGAVILWRRKLWVHLAYVAGVMGPVLISTTPTPKPRFVLAAFPAIIAIALNVRGAVHQLVVVASTGLLALSTILALSGLWLTP